MAMLHLNPLDKLMCSVESKKMIKGLVYLSFEGRLTELGLLSREKSWLRGALINLCPWVSEGRVPRRRIQALLDGAKQQHKSQWAGTDVQEAPPEHQEQFL